MGIFSKMSDAELVKRGKQAVEFIEDAEERARTARCGRDRREGEQYVDQMYKDYAPLQAEAERRLQSRS